MPGIVRASERVAIWHEAADVPTSEPPKGASADSVGQGVAIPNSNKFKTPINGLKKVLDGIPPDVQTSPGVISKHQIALHKWLWEHGAFTKPYFKPGYADAIKASVGNENYDKLLKLGPKSHVTALTTHVQQPAPNSNKFKTPANGLKKLLDTNPSSDQVKQWVGDHPAFHTYLGPEYEDALKSHLGEVNHAKFKIHTTQTPEPKPLQQQMDEGTQKQVDQSKPQPTPDPGGLTEGGPSAPPQYMSEQEQKPVNSPHYDAIKAKGQKGYIQSVPKTIESPAFHQWFHSHTTADQQKMSATPGATTAKFQKWLKKHPEADNAAPQAETQDHSSESGVLPPEKQFGTPKSPHPDMGLGTGGQAAYDEIKKVFPNSGLDPSSSSEEIKSQLESWLKYLPDHEGFSGHVPQLSKIWDKYYGGKDSGPSAPTADQSPQPSDFPSWEDEAKKLGEPPASKQLPDTFGELAHQSFPMAFGEHDADKFNGYSPEKQKSMLKGWINSEQGKDTGVLDDLKAFYDKNYGEPKAKEDLEPADLGYGDEAYTKQAPDVDYDAVNQEYSKIFKLSPQNTSLSEYKNDPEKFKSQLEQTLKSWQSAAGGPDGDWAKPQADQVQALYDKYYGGGKSQGPSYEDMQGVFPGISQETYQSLYSGPNAKEAIKKGLKGLFSNPQAKAKLQVLYDKHYGGDGSAKPTHDTQALAKDLSTALGIDFDNMHQSVDGKDMLWKNMTAEQQKKALSELTQGSTQGLAKKVYEKYFGEESGDPDFSDGGSGKVTLQYTPDAMDLEGLYDSGKLNKNQFDLLMKKPGGWWEEKYKELEAKGGAVNSLWKALETIKPKQPGVSKVKPEWNSQTFADEYNKIFSDHGLSSASSAGSGSATEEKAKSKLEQLISGDPDSSVAENLKALQAKWFGDGAAPAAPKAETPDLTEGGKYPPPEWIKKHYGYEYAPGDLKKSFDKNPNGPWTQAWAKDKFNDKAEHLGQPSTHSGEDWASQSLGDAVKKAHPNLSSYSQSSLNGDSANYKTQLKTIIDGGTWEKQGADNQKLKEIYDAHYGDTYGTSKAVHEPEPVHEPEEDEGVSAPFKGEEVHPEDLKSWTGAKPADAEQWKAFSNWWGKTKVTPEQEQQIYKSWFPHKNATPEQATNWFSKVYGFHAKPSSGDLGQNDAPSWAGSSWAFGDKADKEWPVFKTWASTAPGIPQGTTIKQKVAIWNSLSAGDKKEIEGNYLPKNPVDAKGVVSALKKAYPDSDWSSWDTMPQGTLAQNVENLAKAGYKGAVSVYNDTYGGKLPMPKADEKKPLGLPEPPQVPVSSLPDYWTNSFGASIAQAKEFSGFSHVMKLMGMGDAAQTGVDADGVKFNTLYGSSSKAAKVKQLWGQTPEWLKQQVGAMGTAPFKTPEEYKEWLIDQDTPVTALANVYPEKFGEGVDNYQKNNFSSHPTGYKFVNQAKQFGQMIDKETDPDKKKQLLASYHKFFGGQKETLEQALEKTFPVPPKGVKAKTWNEFLANNDLDTVGATVKKMMKAEKDPEKFVQLVDLWAKYVGGLSGVGAVTNTLGKNLTAGSPVGSANLKQLHKWKATGGPPSTPVPSYWNVDDVDSKYVKNKIDTGDESGYYAPYHGLTPKVFTSQGKADPAMLGSSHEPNYSAPSEGGKGKAYTDLMDSVSGHDAAYSSNDKKLLKSDEFQNWFASQASSYKKVFSHHPGVAIDDYNSFMAGNPSDPEVPESDGTKKVYDVSPFANVPKNDKKQDLKKFFGPHYKPPEGLSTVDYSPIHVNPQRSDTIKFPQAEDAQDTIPLGPGQKFAPQYNAMPIYRVMRFNPNQKTGDPGQDKLLGQMRDILWGRKPQDKPSNPTLFDDEPAQTWPKDAPPIPSSPDQWMGVMDWAKKHDVSSEQMYDLAEKAGATPGKFGQPPLANQAPNYDDPRLAPLLLDYIERSHDPQNGGMGIHWTRSRQKGYEGVPTAGSGAITNNPSKDSIPILVSGLWGGQGEDTKGSGGAYDPLAKSELEHTLLPHAPVHVRRLQIKSPDSDWHDLMDYGPISMWPKGRDEETKDKPSLQADLKKIGITVDDKFDTLTPGPHTDAAFDRLVQKFPNKQKELDKVYQHFFVGRPDLPTKPHTRYASIKAMPRLASMEHSIAILAAIEEPSMPNLSDYERRITALFHDHEDPYGDLMKSEYEEGPHPHSNVTESPDALIYGHYIPEDVW